MTKEKRKLAVVLGLAVGLPSTILGTFYLVYLLMDMDAISQEVGLLLIVAIIAYIFFVMVKYALKK